ncbi:hypothetical protein V6N11_000465 [Hibiscus sabdariffa]|uniref:Uncharacterized protein n=1 Tax=Hibiscus sabdariffa TaxID=183260 RepID=A0ABR2NSZ1_9ROSI
MPSCYASYHHQTTSHRLITHPTKPRSISRLTQHFAKAEDTALLGSPRPNREHGSLGISEAESRRAQQPDKAKLMIPLVLPSIISTTTHPCQDPMHHFSRMSRSHDIISYTCQDPMASFLIHAKIP